MDTARPFIIGLAFSLGFIGTVFMWEYRKDSPQKQPIKQEFTIIDYDCVPVKDRKDFICETPENVCVFDGVTMLCFKKEEKE
jgi:hypothetical protein